MPYSNHLPWFEKLIRDAQEAGEFDRLPGSGKPIDDLDQSYEPTWWARKFVQRERLNEEIVDLATQMRRELPQILASRDEAAARARLESFNEQIAVVNRGLSEGDRLTLLDIDRVLADRRRRHS